MSSERIVPRDAPRPSVLVADDQADVRVALQLLLKTEGFVVRAVASPAALLEAAAEDDFDLVLMDLNYTRDTTSGTEGLDLLERLRSIAAELPVVVMTAWGTLELAVEAMKRGARDFVLKPWDNGALLRCVRQQIEDRAARHAVTADTAATERADAHDLEVARRVQTRFLPASRPPLVSLDYAGRCDQAGAVGGDAYDFLDLGPGRLGVALADASGHGLGAALLVANLQGILRGQAERARADLPGLVRRVNRQFFETTAPEHYATLFLAGYDESRRVLSYVNCGHNPPFLVRTDGSVQRLPATATAIGLLDDWQCASAATPLGAGDTLLLYSDGVTEALGAAGDEFGEARLLAALREGRSLAADALCLSLIERVARFAAGDHRDDRTVVVVRGV